jgi:hypothetical protein
MIMKCRTMSGIENWLLAGGWRENDKFIAGFVK